MRLPSEIEREIYLKWYFPSVLEELNTKYSYENKKKIFEIHTIHRHRKSNGLIQVYQYKKSPSGHQVIFLKPENFYKFWINPHLYWVELVFS
jgi:hypothetical protein